MRYLSVCSGIEAASVAWKPLGWEAAGFFEIEKLPSAVLKHHYPDVRNFGDMTKWEEHKNEIGSVDLLCGGTPCQSFSIAGLRGGLDDERGNLALEYCRMADGLRPRWLVWENVPGVLSSGGGADFRCIVQALVDIGYGVCWRVLDAQNFGVPQRRRRVWLVGYIGDWRPAAAVLFEPESLRGDTAKGGKTGEEVAGTVGARTGRSVSAQDAACGHMRVAKCLTKGAAQRYDSETETFVTQYGYKAGSLTARHDSSPCADRGDNVVARWNDEIKCRICGMRMLRHEMSKHRCMVYNGQGSENQGLSESNTTSPTLDKSKIHNVGVRRLTPVECERLQGFPDDYTNIPGAKDGPRYKALGNSWAVPCARWIGERIQRMEDTV